MSYTGFNLLCVFSFHAGIVFKNVGYYQSFPLHQIKLCLDFNNLSVSLLLSNMQTW